MTPGAPLKSLSITAFRGSSSTFTLLFEKCRKLTLIYGENGTGKSTICDAFEFLAREQVTSLEGYGLGKGLEKYWPSAGRSAGDLSVTLETSAGACSGKISNKKVQITPLSSQPKIELLRRQQILRLIQAQPKERYDAIQRFIDIARFEASEEALRQQSKTLEAERLRAQQSEGQSLQELQGFFETVGSPEGLNPVSWAKQKLAEPVANLDNDISAIGRLRNAFTTLKAFPDRLTTRQSALTKATQALVDADALLAAAVKTVSKDAANTLAVLVAGGEYLHDHPDATECPLCRSKENMAGIENDIASRLANLSTLRTAAAAQQQCTATLTNAKSAITQLNADYVSALAAYAGTKDGYKWKTEIKLPLDNPPNDMMSLSAWLKYNETTSETWLAVEATWRDERKFTTTLKAASTRYEQNLAKHNELNKLVPKLEQALTICVEQRQEFTKNIIGRIAQEVGKLYEQVHPGEGLDSIALNLDPNKRASLDLEANFLGKDVPPQAYFSQSHLDTLGLCVFLALATRDRPAETILILDDIVASVDEPHVERLIGMIYDVSANYRHTLVTTHYRPWREKFRWGVLKPDKVCQFIELKQWTLDGGMQLSGAAPEIVRLKTLLGDPDPDIQSICGKSGVILEALLDFITMKYACAVPRHAGSAYVLSDLLGAVNGKLLAALKVETLDQSTNPASIVSVIELKPILDEISKIAQARNVIGAHFNELSFNLYPEDGIRLAKLVEQFADALICPDYGWPNKDKSGSYWNNGGDTRRLHPLKKPS